MASQAIGIDIGSHAVKVAVLQRKGGVTRALRLYRSTLAGDQDMERARGALVRAGVTGGPGLIGITGRDLIIRYTHVPPVPDWRLKLLMQFEINEVSGQSGGEVAADYRRVQLPGASGEETVLVALARNTWLSPRLEAARAAGMKVAGGCPNSVALFNAFLAHGKWKEGETTYLVSLGRENIDMAIQRDGELLFARNMSGGGQSFTEAIMNAFGLAEAKAEKNKVTKGDITPKAHARYADATQEKLANAMQGPAGQLIQMIQSTVMICRAQTKMTDLNVDRLLLTGGGAQMPGLRDYFQANMSVPVELFDPVGSLDLSALPAADHEELGSAPLDFAVAVGLAESRLQPNGFALEVLTEKEKKKRHFSERTLWAVLAMAAALVFVVLLFNTRSSAIQLLQQNNQELERLLADKKKVEDRQKAALAGEQDARKKEVALRARRLAGDFTRAVHDLLLQNHSEAMYLVMERMETLPKVSLDLLGRPGDTRATMGAEDKATGLHEQQVWPVVEVLGVVQPEYAPNPGQTLNTYYARLEAARAGLSIDGCSVKLDTTALDKNNRFTMTFRLLPAEAQKQ